MGEAGISALPTNLDRMALRDTWHRALVYFGLAEDHQDEYYDE